jgi:hypothetical protein
MKREMDIRISTIILHLSFKKEASLMNYVEASKKKYNVI